MGNFLLIPLVVLSGCGLAVQVAMNARLREVTGSPLLTGIVSFTVGLLFLIALIALASHFGSETGVGELKRAPGWALLGGIFGACFVQIAAVTASKTGPALTLAAAVAGQVVGSLIIEHFGWLAMERHAATPVRIAGAVVIFVGVLLVQLK